MIAESEIRNEVARLLLGEIPLDQFEDWFVERSWNAHLDSSVAAQRLAYAIDLRLAEHSSGHLSEEQLRRELRPLVEFYSVSASFAAEPLEIMTGASNSLIPPLAGLAQPSDTRPSGVSA